MSNENPSNVNFRPSVTDDRPRYRFQEYEDDVNQQPIAPLMQNQGTYNNQASPIDSVDEKHLDQLALGSRIYAAVHAAFACFPVFHLIFGIMIVTGRMDSGSGVPPPLFLGWFFIIFALVFITFGWALSACNFYAGRFLKERRNYTFCFVMSCINCAFMPLGTILGVFSIMVLVRDSVKNLFKDKPEFPAAGNS